MKSHEPPESFSSVDGGPSTLDASLLQAVIPLDKTALGVAVGVIGAPGVAGATIFLIVKDGQLVGPTLSGSPSRIVSISMNASTRLQLDGHQKRTGQS